jgi:hypothetical protein
MDTFEKINSASGYSFLIIEAIRLFNFHGLILIYTADRFIAKSGHGRGTYNTSRYSYGGRIEDRILGAHWGAL